MKHITWHKKQRGFILLEVFLTIMIIGVAFAALLDVGTLSIKTSTSLQKSAKANFLLKESMESVRSYRDGTDWASGGLDNISTGSANPYYFVLDTSTTPATWTLTSGTETTGIFERKIIFDKVSRDPATNNIESTYASANDDPNTRKVTVTVSWDNTFLNLATYLTNWK